MNVIVYKACSSWWDCLAKSSDRLQPTPSVTRAEAAAGISLGRVYLLRPVPPRGLALMRRMGELHLELPFAGSRMLRDPTLPRILMPQRFLPGRGKGRCGPRCWRLSFRRVSGIQCGISRSAG